jgi:2-polyprenyl-3-methyl-5-hydroxy-6-metoxy-1,4-benzoquinol methylase
MQNNRLTEKRKHEIKTRIIRAYDDIIIRTYCSIRFLIMNMRILEELEQYIPHTGVILDVGCGFGLFSLFFAMCAKGRRMIAVDINSRRIAIAKKAQECLGLTQSINFYVSDVANYEFQESVNAIVVLDLLHHIPQQTVLRLLQCFHNILQEDGVLIIKDVKAKPWLKMAFTWVLDKLVDFKAPLHYYTQEEMISIIEAHGFDVKLHNLIDILPYPHILYVCRKKTQ